MYKFILDKTMEYVEENNLPDDEGDFEKYIEFINFSFTININYFYKKKNLGINLGFHAFSTHFTKNGADDGSRTRMDFSARF